MRRTITLTFIAVLVTSQAFAGYVEDRREAEKLAHKRKHDEALAAYTKMAEGDFSDFQKSDALEQAVFHAIMLKNYDLANELAAKIPMDPVRKTCQMRILLYQRKPKDVIAQFAEEDFGTWPESLRAAGYSLRGNAYLREKQGEKAVSDLSQCVLFKTDSRSLCGTYLSLARAQALNGDDQKAIETYRKIKNLSKQDYSQSMSALIETANLLAKQEMYDEALRELDGHTGKSPRGYWRGRFLLTRAGIIRKKGDLDATIAAYESIASDENAGPRAQKTAEKTLTELRAEAAKKTEAAKNDKADKNAEAAENAKAEDKTEAAGKPVAEKNPEAADNVKK